MEQSRLVQTIVEKYHPGNRAFKRVASGEFKAALDLEDPLPPNIWELWEGSFCLEVVNEAKNEPKKTCAEIPSPRAC
jgi:hypothetical protein